MKAVAIPGPHGVRWTDARSNTSTVPRPRVEVRRTATGEDLAARGGDDGRVARAAARSTEVRAGVAPGSASADYEDGPSEASSRTNRRRLPKGRLATRKDNRQSRVHRDDDIGSRRRVAPLFRSTTPRATSPFEQQAEARVAGATRRRSRPKNLLSTLLRDAPRRRLWARQRPLLRLILGFLPENSSPAQR